MKNKKKRAFPVIADRLSEVPPDPGMDLRDYFAAKALSIIPFVAKEVFQNADSWGEKEIADEAYRIADEMMKISEK